MNRTRWLVAPAAALAVVLGGGAGLAATGTGSPDSSFLGDVAKRLGISEDKLENAVEDATIARIDAAVDAGDMTKEQGEALKRRVRAGDAPAMLPSLRDPGPALGVPGSPGRFGHGPFPGTELLDAAASFLGMDGAAVEEALHDGRSLADLARDRGKSVDELEQALRDAIREDADRAVADGVLTKEQADGFAEKLSGAVNELMEKVGRPGPELGFSGPQSGPGLIEPLRKGIIPLPLPGGDLVQAAADYLGIDVADIRAAVRDGKSLADLAEDEGESVDGLKGAIRDAIREDADRAVDDGVLTKEQADRLVEKLGNAVDKLVEGSVRSGLDFAFRGGRGDVDLHLRIAPDALVPPEEPASS